ncbi:hypothetical protein KC338_g268 [Hortaea werneckii]|nr:hypothetical protein KC338_g268 [Hortaea werneckii]
MLSALPATSLGLVGTSTALISTRKPLEPLLYHILKPSFTDESRHILRDLERLARHGPSSNGVLRELRQRMVGRQGPVPGAIMDAPFDLFDVSAGPQVSSKWSLGNTHSLQQSSISNVTLCGCMPGGTGDRSVPITWAVGNLSAMSVAQMPAPVPFLGGTRVGLTKVEDAFGIGSYWRQVQLIVERQETYVVHNGLEWYRRPFSYRYTFAAVATVHSREIGLAIVLPQSISLVRCRGPPTIGTQAGSEAMFVARTKNACSVAGACSCLCSKGASTTGINPAHPAPAKMGGDMADANCYQTFAGFSIESGPRNPLFPPSIRAAVSLASCRSSQYPGTYGVFPLSPQPLTEI